MAFKSNRLQQRGQRRLVLVATISIVSLLLAVQFLSFDATLSPGLQNLLSRHELPTGNASSILWSSQRPHPANTDKICVFTKTTPGDFHVRQCLRNKCGSHAGSDENDSAMHMFVLGAPSYETRRIKGVAKRQGKLASSNEIFTARRIIDEHDKSGDILAVPYRDFTRDESAKQLAALQYGVNHNCSYTVIADGGYCVNVTVIRRMIATHRQSTNEEMYFGYQLFNRTDNRSSTIGPHGEYAPYLSGGYIGASYNLASFIVHQDWTHSVMTAHYGSNNEDSNMGLWVDYARKRHHVNVSYIGETTSNTTRGADKTTSLTKVCPEKEESAKFNHDLCIVTMTRADGFETRQCQRRACRPYYGDSPHLFVVGVPSYAAKEDPVKNQNDTASHQEAEVAGKIIEEHEKFGDILAASHKDYYDDLPEKRMAVLKFGVENKCAYTIKVDDEFCVNVTLVKYWIEAHERDYPSEDLYFGNYQFKGTEYDVQQGVDGKRVPYMSGWCNGASYRLSSYIVNQDWTHTVMRASYGSSSEDVDMGFWVDYAMRTHSLPVRFVASTKIRWEIPNGTCVTAG